MATAGALSATGMATGAGTSAMGRTAGSLLGTPGSVMATIASMRKKYGIHRGCLAPNETVFVIQLFSPSLTIFTEENQTGRSFPV
jgi:hypothetical protein